MNPVERIQNKWRGWLMFEMESDLELSKRIDSNIMSYVLNCYNYLLIISISGVALENYDRGDADDVDYRGLSWYTTTINRIANI